MEKKKSVWHKSKFPGVRYREHPTRKHGIQQDKYFCIFYKLDGKTKSEAIGWASDKWTAEKAASELSELRRNQRKGKGPRTMAEKRELDRQGRERAQKEKERLEREEIKFSHYFEKTYSPSTKLIKKDSSYNAEQAYYVNWIKPVVGDKPFKIIMPMHIEKIKQDLLKAGRAPRTIEYIFAIIRQTWNMAVRDGLIDRKCPTRDVKKPKVNNERQRYLTRDEADRLLEQVQIKSNQTYHFCLISLHCGLRASEIFNLRWQQIDLNKETIFVDGKGDKSRYAFMTEKVRQVFLEMETGGPEELVFKSRKGGPVKRISNAFQRSVKELKFNEGVSDSRQKVVFHTFRHTFASWLVENGTDLYVVQKLLGHASFEMVQRYSHLGENALQSAIKRLDTSVFRENNLSEKIVELKSAKK